MCKMSDSLAQQKLTHFKSLYFKLKVQKRILRKTNALSCSNVQQGTQESGRQGNMKIKLKKRTARQTCLYHYGIKRLGVCVCVCVYMCMHTCSVMSNSVTYGLQPTRLLRPWGSPGKNIGVGCHALLQGILPTQGSDQCLPPWQADSLPLSHLGSPIR